jgi:hypothetical protein
VLVPKALDGKPRGEIILARIISPSLRYSHRQLSDCPGKKS